MTGRADHGSQSWRYPALLSYAQPALIRRGSQEDILAGLRHLLSRPVVGGAVQCPAGAAAAGNTAAGRES